MTMSKRLDRLIERDGAFHEIEDGYGWEDTEKKLEIDKKYMVQTWKNGSDYIPLSEVDMDCVICFDPIAGYFFSKNTGHEKEIKSLGEKITSLKKDRFNLSSRELEEACGDIKDINNRLGIADFKDINGMKAKNRIGLDAIFKNNSATLYLLEDGVGLYSGDVNSLFPSRFIDLIPLKQDCEIYSKEFDKYLKGRNIKFKMELKKNKGKLPSFSYDSDKTKINKNNLLEILLKKEFKPFWEIRASPSVKNYSGEWLRIINYYDEILYRNATNFNRIHGSSKNVNIEIPRNYKYTRNLKDVEENILTHVKGNLENGYTGLASSYLSKKNFRTGDSWRKIQANEELKKDFLQAVAETARTPSIKSSGDIRILSHCPYLKINGATVVHGKPPKNYTHEIDAHPRSFSKTEVIYDYE